MCRTELRSLGTVASNRRPASNWPDLEIQWLGSIAGRSWRLSESRRESSTSKWRTSCWMRATSMCKCRTRWCKRKRWASCGSGVCQISSRWLFDRSELRCRAAIWRWTTGRWCCYAWCGSEGSCMALRRQTREWNRTRWLRWTAYFGKWSGSHRCSHRFWRALFVSQTIQQLLYHSKSEHIHIFLFNKKIL